MPTPDDVIAARGARQSFDLRFNRTSLNAAATSYTVQSLWNSKGRGGTTPTYPTAGLANGRACTKSTGGALQFPDPPTGKSWYLQAAQMQSVDGLGQNFLWDVLAQVVFDAISTTSGAITGCDATARLATGEGGMLFAEYTGTAGTSQNTVNIVYENQDGVGSRATSFLTFASSTAGRAVHNQYLYLPLQAGDTGVRKVTSISSITGTQTPCQLLLHIVRPLYDYQHLARPLYNDRDLTIDHPVGSKIDSNACIMLARSGNSGPTLDQMAGVLKLVAY